MESWRNVWRVGIAPQLSTAGLLALAEALERDAPTLIQGSTTVPPPLPCVQDWAPEGCCPVGYALRHGEGLETVGAVANRFGEVCGYECDRLLNDYAACRWFLSWVDDTPRAEMIAALLPEVRAVLESRQGKAG